MRTPTHSNWRQARAATPCESLPSPRAAIEAGAASIEHGWVLSDDDLALAKKNNVTLVSTDFTVEELKPGPGGVESTIRRSRVDSFESISTSETMSRFVMARPTAIAAAAMLHAVSATGATRGGAPDCTKIDASAAASVLGVPKTRSNSSGRHNKQPPDNMDVLGCAYNEASPNPLARTLTYFI